MATVNSDNYQVSGGQARSDPMKRVVQNGQAQLPSMRPKPAVAGPSMAPQPATSAGGPSAQPMPLVKPMMPSFGQMPTNAPQGGQYGIGQFEQNQINTMPQPQAGGMPQMGQMPMPQHVVGKWGQAHPDVLAARQMQRREARGVPGDYAPHWPTGAPLPSWVDPHAVAANPQGWQHQVQAAQHTPFAGSYQPQATLDPARLPQSIMDNFGGQPPGQAPGVSMSPGGGQPSGLFHAQQPGAGGLGPLMRGMMGGYQPGGPEDVAMQPGRGLLGGLGGILRQPFSNEMRINNGMIVG